VVLSALPEVVTRVFNNLAYSVVTFGGGSSESGMVTVRTLMPFRFLTLTLVPWMVSPCRLDMKGEKELLIAHAARLRHAVNRP